MKKKIFRYCFIFFFLLLFFKIEDVYAYTEKDCVYSFSNSSVTIFQDSVGGLTVYKNVPFISTLDSSSDNSMISAEGECPAIIKPIVKLIKIAFLPLITYLVPVALIIMGSFDYVKAVAANSEEETKKAQKVFIKRLIQAALIFLIVNIVTIVFNIVASSTGNSNINSAANKWLDCWLDDKSQNNLLECKNYCDKKYPSGGEELSNCMIQCNK